MMKWNKATSSFTWEQWEQNGFCPYVSLMPWHHHQTIDHPDQLLIFLSRKKLMTFMHCDSEVLASLMGSASNATKQILLYNVSRCRPFKCLQSVQEGILWTPIAEEGNVVFHFPIPLPSFGKTGKLWSCNKTWYYIHAKMNDRRNHRLLLDGACHTQKYMIYAFE